MRRIDIENRYIDWWLGQNCETSDLSNVYKLVKKVIYHSQPSGFYGMVELIFNDGTNRLVGGGKTKYGGDSFRPRKTDVRIAPMSERGRHG